jgi:REP element-mobilizing transposase RayT
MPRRFRNEEPGAVHHVVAQGNGRRAIVLDDRDRHSYLSRFLGLAAERRWTIHASSLLDTHHHAIVETPQADLSDGMRRILGGHASWFNARHGLEGSVFGERFWSVRVFDHFHLLRACLYALLNPVAAGLVSHPRLWPWSSYRVITELGCSERLREVLGGTPDEADARFLALVDQGVERIHAERASARAETVAIAEELARCSGAAEAAPRAQRRG